MNKNFPLKFILFALLFPIFSCKKSDVPQKTVGVGTPGQTLPDTLVTKPDSSVSINLSVNSIGPVVPNDFLGFSFEKLILTDTTYFNISNTTFINLFKNLGTGLIRIGGATVDKISWANNQRNSPTQDFVFTNDVDRFTKFSQAVGWNTIWGLNFNQAQLSNDAQETAYVKAKLGASLSSIAIGNEPEYFPLKGLRPKTYNYNTFIDEYSKFANGLEDKVPGIIFSGPETNDPGLGKLFLKDRAGKINLFSLHYYRMGPAGNPSVTMKKLMVFDPWLNDIIQYLKPGVIADKVPFRFTECNSVFHGGQDGISNAFGSSLWGTEFLFYLAQQGIAGVNFHTGGGSQYVYSPINTVNNKNVARPLYYAMLLFKQAAVKQFLKTDFPNTPASMDVYSFIRKDGKTAMVVINKDDKKDIDLFVNSKTAISATTTYQLYAPSLSSTSGTNINGASVGDDGTFKVNGVVTNNKLGTSSKWVNLKILAASASLIIFN
ncbi:hypothetical protein SAMN05428975_1967 [Mucilaginibacter sp. OK268]|uniref:glycoside hydrolase family 30 beta sandwich domain-containing protein n=1 Tax=Mucilaginibacter sp. OK268 TaxID=1881048 RepID=UPI0008806F09|nr:glycoside hydrolase family 30 beta sandwich domain-containing protein [Mucilaginibacter sp. OK268]SDP59251.1 hypothetical protein SAMN05428975_1967 [Mucilaginibacter sp. OK268]